MKRGWGGYEEMWGGYEERWGGYNEMWGGWKWWASGWIDGWLCRLVDALDRHRPRQSHYLVRRKAAMANHGHLDTSTATTI